MLKLALCDDEAAQRSTVSRLLREYAVIRPELTIKLSAFASGKELLAEIEEELKTDHGIVFSRVLTQKPDEETIVMRKRHSAGHQRGGYGAGKERLADRQG